MALGVEVGLGPGDIVLDGNPAPPPPKGHSQQFSAHVYCGQMAGSIQMSLGTEVGHGPGHTVLDADPAHLPQEKKGGGAQPPPIFGPCLLWQNDWIDQDGTWYGGGPWPRPHCVRWGKSSTPRGTAPQFSAHVCCGQTAGWIKTQLGTKVGLGQGHIVLDGAQLSPKKGDRVPPIFGPYLLWPNGRPSEILLSSCYKSSAVAEMGNRCQNRHGRKKRELLCPFRRGEPGSWVPV